ncbi:LptF/LptG family permease [Terrihabitans sp. B22-R8]|uniref:LptF/LptG family permease n=1 Tax=Terrihabitans sp. B22-R8 TaxID=3425128 RepID=UPI00403C8EDB
MTALDRYIIRATLSAFLAGLIGTTAVVWVTQSLRSLDLMTTQGQSLWTYFFVTGLAVPSLALVVAPVALFGGVMWVLNRLNADSELAALSAAGVTPIRLFRPFAIVTLLVAIGVGILSTSAIPASLRTIREVVTNIRADVVVNVLRPGAFTTFDQGVTVHVRSRDSSNALLGMLIEDNSSPEQNLIYTAERGQVAQTESGTYLVLERGSLQRKAAGSEEVSIVVFETYAFDLAPLASQDTVLAYRPRERRLMELLMPSEEAQKSPAELGRIRAELHERITNPLYPVVFVVIAFAALGRTRSNRQGRFTAIAGGILAILAVRVVGLALINVTTSSALAPPALYTFLAIVTCGALIMAFGGGFRRLRSHRAVSTA